MVREFSRFVDILDTKERKIRKSKVVIYLQQDAGEAYESQGALK